MQTCPSLRRHVKSAATIDIKGRSRKQGLLSICPATERLSSIWLCDPCTLWGPQSWAQCGSLPPPKPLYHPRKCHLGCLVLGGGARQHRVGILRVLMLVVASCWHLERGWHQDLLIAFLTDFAVALKRISSLGESGRLAGVDFLCRVTKPHFIVHSDLRATLAAFEQNQHRRLSQGSCSWAGGAGQLPLESTPGVCPHSSLSSLYPFKASRKHFLS